MAKREVVELVDDLTGQLIGEGEGSTVHFAFDGVAYTIDLTHTNKTEMRRTLDRYLRNATPVDGPRRQVTRLSDAKVVRAWARQHGYEVPERGAIPPAVQEAYDAAQ